MTAPAGAAPDPAQTVVLVTGGSGFIGSHCVAQLLSAGYTVRTTVRSLDKADRIRSQVLPSSDPSSEAAARLTFHLAELLSDDGWVEATQGCHYVLHVASPFPLAQPEHEDDLIRPAREGTLRVLGFAAQAGVRRVVLTSSYAAVGYGHPPEDYARRVMDEQDWTDMTGPGVGAYTKSKTLAERAAWEYIESHPEFEMELATVNPVAVFGPLLPGNTDVGTTVGLIQRVLAGKLPAAPRVQIGAVDVRDVAALHIAAMSDPRAKGKRFLAIADEGSFVSFQDIGDVLGMTVRKLPDWVVRLGAFVSADLDAVAPELGLERKASNAQAREVLGYKFRTWQESVTSCAESLKREGLVK